MSLNTSWEYVVENRRRKVARLRIRGLTMRQIVQALADSGNPEDRNPKTGAPWSLKTIKTDIDAVIEAARAEAVKDISEHKARLLDELEELKRIAWSKERYSEIRQIVADMRAMLGTDSPKVIVFDQVQERMLEGIERLEAEFANDPDTRDRAIRALVDGLTGRL